MKKAKKIMVIVVILLLVVCVWALKNSEKKELQGEEINNTSNEMKEVVKVEEEIIPEKEEASNIEKNEIIDNIKEEPKKEDVKEIENLEIKKEENIVEKKEIEVEKVEAEFQKEEQSIDKNDPNFSLIATSVELEKLKEYNLPILIDFGSEGCMPCRQMKPTLVELNEELRGKAIVKYIDVWEHPEAADGFDFSLIPTQFFINKDGIIYKQHTGIISKEEVIEILKEMGME